VAAPRIPGGDLEEALLAALWAHGAATPRELYDAIGAARGIVYTTVAKVLDRLVAKGLVTRRASGRTFVYRPRRRPETTRRQIARTMIERLTRSEPLPAMAALVGAIEDVDPALLDELSALIDARRKERR
jgi:predicted transcriptional regulator